MTQPDLFDFGTDPAPVEAADDCTHGETHTSTVEGEPTSRRHGAYVAPRPAMAASAGSVVEWREVPQALFLSWSPARQLAYCAARDEDSVLSAESDEEILFYGRRAASYRELSLKTKGC